MTPDPTRQLLARRIFETFDLVQIVVVESPPYRLEGFGDVGEIDDPSKAGIQRALDVYTHAKRVTVKPLALVPLRDVWKQVRRFECELFPDLHLAHF